MYGIIARNQESQSTKDYYICNICNKKCSKEEITRREPAKNHIYGHIRDQIKAPDTPNPLQIYKYELEEMLDCYNQHNDFMKNKNKKIQFHCPETEKELNELHY